MLEDAPPKKPPDKIVLPYGPKVQTVKFPKEAKGYQAQTFIRHLGTATQLAPYKHLTKEEYKKTVNDETNKKNDPCDIGKECKQDIEIQDTPETPEDIEDIINWEHKEEIAEAEGKIIKSDREWAPGYIPEEESNTEKKENTELEAAENQEALGVDKYDAMQAFSESIKKKREPNPVSTRKLIRTIKENQNKEKEIWKRTEKKKQRLRLRPGKPQYNGKFINVWKTKTTSRRNKQHTKRS